MKTLTYTTMMILSATMLSAQTPATTDTGYTATVRARWNAVKKNVTGSAQAMPEANYGYKPTAEVRGFGELIGHLANAHYGSIVTYLRLKGIVPPSSQPSR